MLLLKTELFLARVDESILVLEIMMIDVYKYIYACVTHTPYTNSEKRARCLTGTWHS